MIKHMIATAIDHSGFDDCVVETGTAHDFFRGPFRFMIRGPTIWTCSQETHEHDLTHARRMRNIYDVSGGLDMYPLISLLANFTIDACAMSNGITAREGLT